MPRTVHPPEWPDKVMFAAMLVVIAGTLGAIFALLRLGGLRISRELTVHLDVVPASWGLVLCLVAIVLGLYGIRHQAAVWVWGGVGAGILSGGMLGLVPLLSLLAILFLVRSRAEGEETRHDGSLYHASLWPDKALAASLLLFVGGVVSLFQGALVLADSIVLPSALAGARAPFGAACVAAGAWALYASLEVYRLRRPWTGYVAAGAAAATVGFLVVGPALALAAFLCLQNARAEKEFEDAPAPA